MPWSFRISVAGKLCSFKPVTAADISAVVRSFRNGKAQDIHGLAAEHLKNAMELIDTPLANMMSFILSSEYIPVLEKILQKRTEHLLSKNQSKLQRGFTKKSSSVSAALPVSEVQNEAKD